MLELENKNDITEETEENQTVEKKDDIEVEQVTALVPEKKAKKKSGKNKGEKGDSQKEFKDEYQDFPDMAELLNTTVKELKEEFYFFQIRKFMSRLKRVVVRYDVTDNEIKGMLTSASLLTSGGLLVAPVYLPACAKQTKKHGFGAVNVGAVIDFPFGESSFKSKLSSVKECIKIGADQATVAIPSMLLAKTEIKNFKKQVKKLGKIRKIEVGVSLNASDLDEDKIKLALKILNKSKLAFITFAFGDATFIEVKEKLRVINKYRTNKKICVLANADRAEAITELFKFKVDYILTPYADAIGDDLLKRFNLKV